MLSRGGREKRSYIFLVRMYNDTILMEGNLTISLKITYAYAHELTISL